jgi:uncharacterized membrane protein
MIGFVPQFLRAARKYPRRTRGLRTRSAQEGARRATRAQLGSFRMTAPPRVALPIRGSRLCGSLVGLHIGAVGITFALFLQTLQLVYRLEELAVDGALESEGDALFQGL